MIQTDPGSRSLGSDPGIHFRDPRTCLFVSVPYYSASCPPSNHNVHKVVDCSIVYAMPSATREFALFGLDSTHSEPEEMEIQISHDLVSGRYLRTSESRLRPMVSGRLCVITTDRLTAGCHDRPGDIVSSRYPPDNRPAGFNYFWVTTVITSRFIAVARATFDMP